MAKNGDAVAAERLADIMRLVSDWIWETDANLNFSYATQRVFEVLGFHPVELIGKSLEDLGEFTSARAAIGRVSWSTPFRDAPFDARHRDGTIKHLMISAIPVFSKETGDFLGIRGTAHDVTARKKAEEKVTWQANHDMLTALPNRSLFHERLNRALVQSRREDRCVALLFVDLDRFKAVNDSMGHAVGDKVLIETGNRLVHCVRESDTVARYGESSAEGEQEKLAVQPLKADDDDWVARLGGDEFTVILASISRPEDATVVAQRIINSLTAPFDLPDGQFQIGASIGISTAPSDAEDAATLLRHADVAMYRAKRGGRNRYSFYTEELDRNVERRLEVETDLRSGLGEEQFVVFYQPIIDISTGKIDCAEALVRWIHPERGLVGPDEFISVAEEAGLINQLGEYVLRSACVQAKSWIEMMPDGPGLAVNVSTKQLPDGLSPKDVATILDESGVSPTNLNLEITESLLMEDTDYVRNWMGELREMGVKLSIDDFGTGYSSLSYLRRFPVDSLKIDRSFISNVTTNHSDATLVEAILSMASALQIEVVSEGVETKEQLEFLRAHNCTFAQGFHICRPVAEADFKTRLVDWQPELFL